MSVSKKITDLPKKSISSKKADTVKGGKTARPASLAVSSSMRTFLKKRN